MPLLGGLGIAVPVALLGLAATAAGHITVTNWNWVYINYTESFGLLFSFAAGRHESTTLGSAASLLSPLA